ncbi:MAG: sodium-dependent transporter [Myxococcota bacterium]
MATIPQDEGRGNFGSLIGFVMAGAGSAIGLGNIWRFPYMTGESGGAAFLLVYLGFVALIGVPVLYAELAMGRASQRNPVGAFAVLGPKGNNPWAWVGGLGVVTGFAILAFYSVVAGWTLGYVAMAVSGQFSGGVTPEESGNLFGGLVSNPLLASGLTALFLVLTALVVRGGVQKGIERATSILMPVFLVLLVLLAIRSVTLPGALQGVEFLFLPDFSKITHIVVVKALGQALFSLSLGMGAMITYGSYLDRKSSLPFAGATVALFDTAIAVLAGLIIFPALFSAGVDPSGGAGLVFVVMPTIFEAMPLGDVFAVAFYVLLATAALTSTVSLLEVIVSYLVDERGMSRETAVWATTAACLVLAIPSALAQGAVGFFSSLPGLEISFLDLQNNLWGNYSLSIGALLMCLFTGWVWGVQPALEEMEASGDGLPLGGLWGFLVRVVCPLAIAGLLVYITVTGDFF